jgi:hypothetical protein
MADRLDVAERLAEGRPAVEHTQRYVRACQMLGYEHPDLTSHPSQIRDWYDSEDGLDLRALDGDCAELRAAAAAVTDALRIQRAQVADLAAAWTGPGADSAVGFLQRHCDAASTVATEVRAAAQRCESLRDNLWHLLDLKVATAIAIDDRTLAHRPAWLAAADTVTTAVGDRPTADELVDQQIKPYVENDIRIDWLTVMRSTQAGVAASYDMATDRMAAASPAYFEIPGDLGPGRQPFQPAPPSAPAATAAVAPAAAFPSPSPDPAPAPTSMTAAAAPAPTTPATPASDLGTALGDAAAMPAGAGGLGGLGDPGGGLSGLGGLASRIVDAMSGLLGSAADQLTDPSALDGLLGGRDPFDEDAFDEDLFHPGAEHDDADDKPDTEADEADEPKETEEADETEDAEASEEARPVDGPPPVDAPAPAAVPPIEGSVPPVNGSPPDPTEGSTPCEIAADELPQAGR